MARNVLWRMAVGLCCLSVWALLLIFVQHYKFLVSPVLHSSVHFDQKSFVPAAMTASHDTTASSSESEKERGDPAKIPDSSPRVREHTPKRDSREERRSVLEEKTLWQGRSKPAAILKPKVNVVPGAERSDFRLLTPGDDLGDSGWFGSLFLPPRRAHENSSARMRQGQPRKKILLLTYVRSGSSLTGDIIDHNSEVYYVYEPLFNLQQLGKRVDGGIKEFITENTQFVYAARIILHRLLSCDLSELPGALHETFLARSKESAILGKCYNKVPRSHRAGCLETAESVCRSHDAILLKVVRYPVSDLRHLLALHPELKVIYLVRDVRAAFWSRMNVLKYPARNNFTHFARDLCARMRDDIASALDLLNTSSDHIRFLRYEDLAADPLRVSERMYKFLHLHWTHGIQDLVLQQTNFSAEEAGIRDFFHQNRPGLRRSRIRRDHLQPYTVVRSDSSATARAWRKTISWDVVQRLQEVCEPVMNFLGYTPLTSLDEVRNQSLPCVGAFKTLRGFTTLNPDLGNG